MEDATEYTDSFLDPAHFGPVVIIQLSRIYDVLLALLGETNPELAANLSQLHESGILVGPDPAVAPDSES